MKLIIKFMKDAVVLTSFAKEIDREEDFFEADKEARDMFHKENPGVLLMDGINILYDSE